MRNVREGKLVAGRGPGYRSLPRARSRRPHASPRHRRSALSRRPRRVGGGGRRTSGAAHLHHHRRRGDGRRDRPRRGLRRAFPADVVLSAARRHGLRQRHLAAQQRRSGRSGRKTGRRTRARLPDRRSSDLGEIDRLVLAAAHHPPSMTAFADYVTRFDCSSGTCPAIAAEQRPHRAWLSSSLRISPDEQIQFLSRPSRAARVGGGCRLTARSRRSRPPAGWVVTADRQRLPGRRRGRSTQRPSAGSSDGRRRTGACSSLRWSRSASRIR